MTLHFMSQSLSYRGDGMKDDTKQKLPKTVYFLIFFKIRVIC